MEVSAEEIIRKYTQYLSESGMAGNSLISYERDIRQFTAWVTGARGLAPEAVGAEDIEAYIAGLRARGLTASTISRHITSLRRFFGWAREKNVILIDPMTDIQSPKVIRKSPEILSADEIGRMIAACDADSARGLRDIAMLRLLSTTGISISEILGARTEDLDQDLSGLSVAWTERSARRLRINEVTAQAIRMYLDCGREVLAAGKPECGTLFLSTSGRGLSRQGLCKNLKLLAQAAGIKRNVTPAVLRQSYAVNAIRDGVDPYEVQRSMGLITANAINEYIRLAEN